MARFLFDIFTEMFDFFYFPSSLAFFRHRGSHGGSGRESVDKAEEPSQPRISGVW